MTRLIAIVGRKGSGKSLTAAYLKDAHEFKVIKFADTLKDMLKVAGLNYNHLEGELKEKPCELLCGKSPREAMQTLGTEWGREMIGDNFWVNSWSKRAADYLRISHKNRVVVDDLRFLNEARAVIALGGKIIRINRPSIQNTDTHISENEMDQIKHSRVINNNRSIHALLKSVERCLTHIDSRQA